MNASLQNWAARAVLAGLVLAGPWGASRVHATVSVSMQEGVAGYNGTQDTQLYGQQPTTNYASTVSLGIFEREVGTTNFIRDVIRFDLSSTIAPGSPLASATLTLTTLPYAFDATGVLNSLYIIDPADVAWTESGATWNSAVQGTQVWAGGPGLVSGIDYNATAVAPSVATPNVTPAQQLGGIPMTFVLNAAGIAAVQGWIDNPSSNTGFFIRQPSGSHSVDQIHSSESATVSFRPLLTLEVPEPASLGFLSVGGLLLLRRRAHR